MRIVGIYDEVTKKFVEKQAAELQKLGYSVETLPLQEAEAHYEIKYAPCFGIVKTDKIGYLLGGKQNFNKVLQWAQNSGI